jgi:DnaJ-class molecular chaperone
MQTATQRPAEGPATTCQHCRGTGRLKTAKLDGDYKPTKVMCYHCRGTGKAPSGYERK